VVIRPIPVGAAVQWGRYRWGARSCGRDTGGGYGAGGDTPDTGGGRGP